MSFDEQLDDPHGECAAEIHRLAAELRRAKEEITLWKSNHKFGSEALDEAVQDNIKDRTHIRELEAGMREIVALGDCDDSASKMYFVARRFVPAQSSAETKDEVGGSHAVD